MRTCWQCALILSISFWSAAALWSAPTINDFDAAGTNYTVGDNGVYTPAEAGGGPSGDFLQLTDGAIGESNRAAFDRTAIGLYKTVTASFDFRFTPVIGQADGMGVAFLRTADHGITGSGPGFSEEPNLNGGSGAILGIGLDIYKAAASIRITTTCRCTPMA